MFVSRTLQRVRPFEGIRPNNLHLPSVIGLRTHNRNPPISGPVGKHMFDDRSNICLQTRIPRMLHLDRNCHTAKDISANLRPQTTRNPWRNLPRGSSKRRMIGAIAIAVAHARKRGHPNWGRPMPPAPALTTEFELGARHLQLTPEMYVPSPELSTWCRAKPESRLHPSMATCGVGGAFFFGFDDSDGDAVGKIIGFAIAGF